MLSVFLDDDTTEKIRLLHSLRNIAQFTGREGCLKNIRPVSCSGGRSALLFTLFSNEKI
jgi:hypothetical protein